MGVSVYMVRASFFSFNGLGLLICGPGFRAVGLGLMA